MNNVVSGLDIDVEFEEEKNIVVVDDSGEIIDKEKYEYVRKMSE